MLKGKLKPNFGLKSLILTVVCGLLIAADLLTKHFAKLQLWDVKIIPGWVELSGYVPNNRGCAFSFLNENPQIGQPIFIALTFVMLALLIALFIFMPERFTLLKISVTLITSGAAGNLVDRLAFRSVRDFFGLNMLFNGGLVYCNLADFFVVIGAVLAIIDILFFNEFAVFPLTKSAKAAQSRRKDAEADGDKFIKAEEPGESQSSNADKEVVSPQPAENSNGMKGEEAEKQENDDGGV